MNVCIFCMHDGFDCYVLNFPHWNKMALFFCEQVKESQKCLACRQAFPSRSKLFEHLKTSGHAVPLTVKQEAAGMDAPEAGRKKNKRKGKQWRQLIARDFQAFIYSRSFLVFGGITVMGLTWASTFQNVVVIQNKIRPLSGKREKKLHEQNGFIQK